MYKDKNKEKTNTKRYYSENKDRILKTAKAWRMSFKGRYLTLRSRGRKKNLKVTISFDEYKEIVSKHCHYCGLSVEGLGAIGLDRIDNNKG